MSDNLFIPVILGTTRKGSKSEYAARLVYDEAKKKEGIDTELFDIRNAAIAFDDAGESIKDNYFSEMVIKADGLIILAAEYNHGYPGMLKHLLDTNLKEYIHKAVGICGISSGPFGGSRAIENLLPVMRELGLVTIFWDVNFSHSYKLFDENGQILDVAYFKRIDKFLDELIWMSKTLKYGRLNISQ